MRPLHLVLRNVLRGKGGCGGGTEKGRLFGSLCLHLVVLTSCFLGDQRWARRARLHVPLTPGLGMGAGWLFPNPRRLRPHRPASSTFVASVLGPKPPGSEKAGRWLPRILSTLPLISILGRELGQVPASAGGAQTLSAVA